MPPPGDIAHGYGQMMRIGSREWKFNGYRIEEMVTLLDFDPIVEYLVTDDDDAYMVMPTLRDAIELAAPDDAPSLQ